MECINSILFNVKLEFVEMYTVKCESKNMWYFRLFECWAAAHDSCQTIFCDLWDLWTAAEQQLGHLQVMFTTLCKQTLVMHIIQSLI